MGQGRRLPSKSLTVVGYTLTIKVPFCDKNIRRRRSRHMSQRHRKDMINIPLSSIVVANWLIISNGYLPGPIYLYIH